MVDLPTPSGVSTIAEGEEPRPPDGVGMATLDHEAALAKVLGGLFDAEVVAEMVMPGVGRFEISRRIGSGGMGSVYEARDPELDRRVAIKVLHPDAGAPDRLVEEGKAMARLNHPNVVTVHEVGRADGRIFVVMELVEGDTLRRWQQAREHSWGEIVQMYQSVGQGIAAAHRSGLVHCDLKPENVLVGDDGRPRVTDFGIARLHRPELRVTDDGHADEDEGERDLGKSSTRLAGTPRYMSPEQYAGGVIDHRADQFGYCVMLWEALYGASPFAATSVAALAIAITHGDIEAPPPGRAVPQWLRRICERGLSRDPADRWPDMPALLEALGKGRDRARRRRIGWGLAAAGVLVASGYGAHQLRQNRIEQDCATEGAAIEEIWGPEPAAEVRRGMLDVGGETAGDTADRVQRWLDERAGKWREVATDTCLARELTPTADAEAPERAAWCLADRKAELEMTVELLRNPTRSLIEHAVLLVSQPFDIEGCADEAALARIELPPPEQREQVREIHRELVRADSTDAGGDRAAAEAIATEALKDAEALGWDRLEAKARGVLAKTLMQSGRTDEARAVASEAYFSAITLGDLITAKSAAERMIYIEGELRGELEAAQLWARLTDVLIDQLDQRDTPGEVYRLVRLAEALRFKGRRDEAQPLIERALGITARTLGTEHPRHVFVIGALSTNLRERGQLDEALVYNRQEVESDEAIFGPDSPQLATSLMGLGATYSQAGRHAEAKEALQRAYEIFVRTVGPESGRVASVTLNLAGAEQALGNEEVAIELLQEALAGLKRVLGPGHVRVGIALNNLGNALKSAGRREEARDALQSALEIFETELESDYPHVAFVSNNLGELEVSLGNHEVGKTLLERSLAIRERELGPDHIRLLNPIVALGDIQLEKRDLEGARAYAERAAVLLSKNEDTGLATTRALARLLMASVLWEEDPQRAREVAIAAREEMVALGADGESGAARVELWLEKHPE